MLQDGCVPGFGDYLLAKLVSSGVLRADERFLEASIKMSGKLVPDRQSGHGAIAGAGVRCEVARFGGPPSRLPGRRAVGRWVVSLRCLVGRGVISDADAMDLG